MKKLSQVIIFFFLMISFLKSQTCTPSTFTFTTQGQIDSFLINYPNCTDILGSINIEGSDIINLEGLSQITTINWHLNIVNTELVDLSGLENLTSIRLQLRLLGNNQLTNISSLENLVNVGMVIIEDNDVLGDLYGLNNLELSSPSNAIFINNCPSLQTCEIESICDFLADYGLYEIYNNGEGCNRREEIVERCMFPIDTTNRLECHFDGFETWENTWLYLYPTNWEASIGEYNNQLNIERAEALNEGDYSLRLRSNIPFFEGNMSTTIELPFEEYNSKIDITFTYKCLGEGSCRVNLHQGDLETFGTNTRNIWNARAGDSSQYTVDLQNIEVNDPFEVFKSIELEASPIGTAVGSYGISEFIIDSFLIRKRENSTATLSVSRNNIEIYPNPVKDVLMIHTDDRIEDFYISNSYGQVCMRGKFSERIIVDNLSSGLYIVVLNGKVAKTIRKFIKT